MNFCRKRFTFSPLEISYTNIHSWNVRGTGVNYMDQFLHKLAVDKPWESPLLQEAIYTRKVQAYTHCTGDGHRVFARTPQAGQRSCAIIVKSELSSNILENTFQKTRKGLHVGYVFWRQVHSIY